MTDTKSAAAQGPRQYSLRPVVAVLLVMVLYLLTRAPFYLQPIMGEEGIFAHLIAAGPKGPEYGLVARFQGQAIYAALRHPAFMYEIYTRLGALLRWLMGPGQALTDIDLRLAQSFFEGALWVVLAWRFGAARGSTLALLGALALFGLSSPLGLSASIYLQTDTSSGLLLAGGLGLAVAEGFQGVTLAALFALGAVGKQEWTVAALAGLGLAEGLAAWQALPRPAWRGRWGRMLGALAAGHLVSAVFDWENYWGGWHVLGSISGGQAALASQSGHWWQAWSKSWGTREFFVLSLLGLLVPGAWLAVTAPRETKARELAAAALAWALFLPFIYSTWSDTPRYFAPAWAAALASLAVQCSRRRPRWPAVAGPLVLAFFLCLFQVFFAVRVWQTQRSLTEYTLQPTPPLVSLESVRSAARGPHGSPCVAHLTTGFAWDGTRDFIDLDVSQDDAAVMARAHGSVLCPSVDHL